MRKLIRSFIQEEPSVLKNIRDSGVENKYKSSDRYCRICGARLSIYNKRDICFHHQIVDYPENFEDDSHYEDRDYRTSVKSLEIKIAIPNDGRAALAIMNVVSKCYGVPIGTLLLSTKTTEVMWVRRVAIYLIFEDLKKNFNQIASDFKYHATTVKNAVRIVKRETEKKETVKEAVEKIHSQYIITSS